MNKEINTHINTLQNGMDFYDNIHLAVEFVLSKDSDYLTQNRIEIASLFYQILCSFSRLYKEEASVKAGHETHKLFRHISGLNTDPSIQEDDSNLTTVWFLNELYQKYREGQGINIDKSEFEKAIIDLMPGLNDIKYIFKIKDENNERYFPINRLILKVIEDESFISGSKITPYHIRIFQLAVELFEALDEKDALEKIKKKCNLEFLDYIDGNLKMIDTFNHVNYQKNGVMIFYNQHKESVLIRHEKEDYFNEGGTKNSDVKTEYNVQGDPIGYYIILSAHHFEFITYAQALERDSMRMLKLIYEQGCYNIFFDKSLYIYDGVIYPINKYCSKDKFIISDSERSYSPDKLKEVLAEYNCIAIKEQTIDFVSIGLLVQLLQQENVGVDKLLSEDFANDDWMQNQILERWVRSCNNQIEALKYSMSLWCKELAYCRTKLKEHTVNIQPLLPLKCDLSWMNSLLKLSNTSYIYHSYIDTDENGEVCLVINNMKTLAGKNMKIETPVYMGEDFFEPSFSETERTEFKTIGTEHYIIYDSENNTWKCYKDFEYLFQLYSQVQLINECGLDYSISKRININQLNCIKELMKLHEQALLLQDVKTRKYIDFNSMAIYRLIHNMLWSKITAENWDSYYRIITQHQKADFSSISEDNWFHLDEEGTLFLPKEKQESDSTLYRVYTTYLTNHTCRDSKSLYAPKITYDEKMDKYLINGIQIKKLVFLFDNICSGHSTICTLATYLDKLDMVTPPLSDRNKALYEKKILLCNVDGQIVPLTDIIKKNEGVQIHVHSYYSSDKGIENVLEFLKKCGYHDACVDCKKRLNKDSSLVFENIKEIWPEQAKRLDDANHICIFIREFNQPKKNVFPDEMLTDAYLAICLFVKKAELN